MPESRVTVPSLVVSAWRTAPPVLRRFAYWVWGIGFVSVVLAVVADTRNWWGGLQFTSNIIAEIVCSMVALPVALVIIGRLAEYQVKEIDRVRLDRRYGALRKQMAVAVRDTVGRIQDVEQEVSASTNDFARAVKAENGALADVHLANEAARTIHAQTDSQQWLFYEHIMARLRILGTHLQNLLDERDRNGDPIDESADFARLWIDLESALAHQRQIMATAHELFRTRPAVTVRNVTRANRLRDAAIEHLRGIDRLLELCEAVEKEVTGPDLRPS
ncbi:hypothetical protein JIG36_36905 [Actinoplanes sp. LDG1-06]|uniref:Uncharacterized protein n=1 Tax=Paractinoplanes ovalisporus TaxID=2810368 RepID=A0ABS2AMR9_9ACTN|nr:hypothetical protein [Actinoplanes ovalisporus]MBM2621095.1 hypothetical protein [Actinoplanes ovalisporus]